MSGGDYIIDVNQGGHPFNVRMVLPLMQLQIVMPLIREEMMQGLADNDKEGNVILHLQLTAAKISEIKNLLQAEKAGNKNARAKNL